MKILAIISTVIAICLGVAAVTEHSKLSHARQSLAVANQKAVETTTALAAESSQASDLQSNVVQMTQVMSDASAKLLKLRAENADYKRRLDVFEAIESQKSDRKQLADQVPIIHNGDLTIFPRLIGVNGNTLMLNAEFRSSLGRKLIFKKGLEMSTFDVDDLHPGVLIHLGLDAEKLKANQIAIERANAMSKSLSAAELSQKLSADQVAIDKQNKLNAEQARQDEYARENQVAESQRQQSLDSDRIHANAHATAAKAMLINALNPP